MRNASRHVVGVLRGYDQFMNIVLDNTVLSLDASRAALGVALADADKGVANARAELDKALAAAEASYESLAAGPKALAADAEKAVANSALLKFTHQ